MSATERVRELLDERGVEWTEGIARPELTQVRIDGKVVKFHQWQPNTLKVSLFDITPEQAIAATLGLEPDYAAIDKLHDRMNVALLECERKLGIEKADGTIVVPFVFEMHNLLEEAAALGSCNCTNDCTNGERTRACLPHFWTHDGTLHVELPKLPESISVRLPDQRDREVGSARVWQYTRDSGTCHDKNGFDQDTGFECTVCGAMVDRYMITPDDTGHEVQFHYCPFCGVEVDA